MARAEADAYRKGASDHKKNQCCGRGENDGMPQIQLFDPAALTAYKNHIHEKSEAVMGAASCCVGDLGKLCRIRSAKTRKLSTFLLSIRASVKSLNMKKFNNINELLESSDGRLMSLRIRSRARSQVLAVVRAALPPELEATVVSAGIEQGRLTLGVAGGAWASRLRYRTEALRKRVAGTLGQDIHSVRIKVVQPQCR